MSSGSRVVMLACWLVLPLLAGCGGGKAAPGTAAAGRATVPAADRQIAEAAVLRPGDLPAGWTTIPQDGQSQVPTCPVVRRLRTWPRAVSPGFARGDSAGVHTVTVFPTAAVAERMLAGLVSPANVGCVARSFTADWLTRLGADVAVGQPVVSRRGVARLAGRVRALRYALPLRRGRTRARVFADYVYAVVGRGLAVVWIHSTVVPPDGRVRAALTQTAVERLREALASPAS